MNEPKRIMYRGLPSLPMIQGWPERIQATQRVLPWTLSGMLLPRVPYEPTDGRPVIRGVAEHWQLQLKQSKEYVKKLQPLRMEEKQKQMKRLRYAKD